MVVVVSTNTPKLQSTHYPVLLWLSHRETEPLEAARDGHSRHGFPAAGQAPFSRAVFLFHASNVAWGPEEDVPVPAGRQGGKGAEGILESGVKNSCSTRVHWALFDARNVLWGALLTPCRWGKMKHQIPIWSLYVYFGDVKCKWIVCKTWARVRRKSCILSSKWQITWAAGAVVVFKVARNNQWNYSLVLRGCLSAIMEIRYHQNCWKNFRIIVCTIWGYDSNI